MAWAWNPLGVAGLAAGIACVATAVFVLAVAPSRRTPRWLAAMLLVEGAGILGGSGIIYFMTDAADAFASQAMSNLAVAVLPGIYLGFLRSLDPPLLRWTRGRIGDASVAALLVVPLVWFFVRPADWIVGVQRVDYAPWEGISGPMLLPSYLVLLVVYVFSLVIALDMLRKAPRGLRRRQAAVYAAAFGWRDVLLGLSMATVPEMLFPSVPNVGGLVISLGAIVYAPLVAYGIVSAHLFDIDLKVKWTLRQSTVAAIFLAVFFAVSEGAAAFFGDHTGSAYVGIGAASLLVFALSPLQRLASRITDVALPDVQDTEEFRTVRKREVYRAAVESAALDGTVTSRERDVLATLADQLGLTAGEARAIERAIVGA